MQNSIESSIDISEHLSPSVVRSFSFRNACWIHVKQVINKLKNKESRYAYDLNIIVIKKTKKLLIGKLCKLINNKIRKGVHPHNQKLSIVIAFAKTKNVAELNDLRPIALYQCSQK